MHSIATTNRTEAEVLAEINRTAERLAASRRTWGSYYGFRENQEARALEERLEMLWEEKRAARALQSYARRNGHGAHPHPKGTRRLA